VVKVRDKRTRAIERRALGEEITYDENALDRFVVSPDQIRTVVRAFSDKLFTDLSPGRTEVPKTPYLRELAEESREVVGETTPDGEIGALAPEMRVEADALDVSRGQRPAAELCRLLERPVVQPELAVADMERFVIAVHATTIRLGFAEMLAAPPFATAVTAARGRCCAARPYPGACHADRSPRSPSDQATSRAAARDCASLAEREPVRLLLLGHENSLPVGRLPI